MSLIHWWPLNGDTKDYGIGNVSLVNNGATIDNNGKIGKCYSFSNNNMVVGTSDITSATKISLCLWLKISTSHSGYAQVLVLGTSGTNWNNIRCGIDITGDGKVYFNTSTGSANTNIYSSSSYKDGIWHHIAGIYNNGSLQLYIDGSLVTTGTTVNAPALSGTSIYVGGNAGGEKANNGDCINDVRIYNHALSVKEVREISKGLMLHYNFEELNNNLISIFSSSEMSANATRDDTTHPFYGFPVWKLSKSGATSNVWQGIYQNLPELKTGDKVVLSCYIYTEDKSTIDQGSELRIIQEHTDSTTNWAGISWLNNHTNGKWVRYTKAYTLDSNLSFAKFNINIVRNGTLWVSGIKVEYGESATEFDGYKDTNTIVYDNSGYNYNGTINGSVQIMSNSKSGKYCINLNGTGDISTNLPVLNYLTKDKMTMSFWIYPVTNISTGNASYLVLGASDYPTFDLENSRWFSYNANNNPTVNATAINVNTWYHIAYVFENNTIKRYVNGVLNSGDSINVSSFKDCNVLVLGRRGTNGNRASCWYGDFKIYATALTSSDIMLEYNRKASIDKNGNIYSGEFSQTANNISLPTKISIVKANHFVEGGNKTSLQESYIELEYISFSGTNSAGQFIRTGITALIHPFSVRTVYNKTNTESRDQSLVGQRGVGKYPNIYYNTYETVYVRTDNYTAPDNIKTSVEIRSGTGVLRDNEVIYSTNNTDNKSSNYELLIGAFSETDYTEAKWFYSGNIYEITIISNGILIRDFIPAKRKSDNTLGLYDIINKQFYTNQGTGTFTAGPELNKLNVIYTNQLIEN